jgi:hypothetical protein
MPSCRHFNRCSIHFDPDAQRQTEFNILARTMKNLSLEILSRTRTAMNLSQAVRQRAVTSRAGDPHDVEQAVQLVGRLP